jgi:hypothetical protein
MKKIAIIGAGIFGIHAGLELSKYFNVKIFERHSDIIPETTSQNMYRHHMGYHYPRSDETVNEIKLANASFVKEYEKCLVKDFPAYYSVSKVDSMSTKDDVLRFMDRNKLPYEIVDLPDWMINKDRVSLCFRTPESVYDPYLMRELLLQKIRNSKLNLFLNHEIIDGNKNNKSLIIKNKTDQYEESFDIIINATYSHFNTFNKWFNFETKEVQYDLMELLVLKLPVKKYGMLILDGLFCTILPIGNQGTFVLGHVKHTMLKRLVAKEMQEIHKTRIIESNKNMILNESAKWMPILKKAKIIKSMYSTRVIKPHREHDDARPTEITEYGDGFYSIFAGKVITAVQTANELVKKIKNEK